MEALEAGLKASRVQDLETRYQVVTGGKTNAKMKERDLQTVVEQLEDHQRQRSETGAQTSTTAMTVDEDEEESCNDQDEELTAENEDSTEEDEQDASENEMDD